MNMKGITISAKTAIENLSRIAPYKQEVSLSSVAEIIGIPRGSRSNELYEELGGHPSNGQKRYVKTENFRKWCRENLTNSPHKITSKSCVVKNVELTHKGGCGELHFHNCNVTIHISK